MLCVKISILPEMERKVMLELAPLHARIKDMQQRFEVLRGYL